MSEDKKEKIIELRGSLASRILIIAMIFLVLPLLFLSFLLYKEDGRIKADNNYFTLSVLMKKKVEEIDTVIMHERDFLSGMGFLLQKVKNPQSLLTELAKRDEISALFHIRKEYAGYYICDMSSETKYQGKNFNALMKASQKGVYLVVTPKDQTFFLTRASNDGNEAWVMVLSFDHFIENFPIEKEILYPSATTLLSEDGSVITSTDPELKDKRFGDAQGEIPLNEEEAPHFFFEEEKYIAIKQHVPQTNFSLLISAPQKINFVDIPYFLLKVGVVLGLIILIGGGGVIWLTMRLSKPLKHFIRVMSKVGRGDLTQRFACDAMGFEFNILGEIFNETVQSLTYHMQEAEQERVEKETYATELMIGEEVQNSILPKELPEFPGLEIAARFIAAKEVGGDFYDFLVDDKLMLSIADTAGKGISACLYSLSVRSMLRSYGIIHQKLDVIVNETNELFCLDTRDTGVFVTAFVAIFDPTTKELHYTNCGHFPALLLRRYGAIEKLTTEGMAFGVIPYERVTTQRVKLEPGDLLVLFTDGVVEARNPKQELFGEERLIEFLNLKKTQSPQQIVDDLIEEVAMFAEGSPQHDDLTVVVIRIQ
jgi:phosphoserine phosphatase RsbU/P